MRPATVLVLLGAMTYNLVRLRRQGMHWNGPASFSEFRALQRERERG